MDEALPEYKEKPGSCLACGNSPVNHFGSYLTMTVAVWSSHVRLSSGFARFLERWDTRIFSALMAFGARVRLVSFAHDPKKARTYRSQVIWEEAARRGIRMEQLIIVGHLTDTYRAFLRGTWEYFESIPTPPEIAQESYQWLDDKYVLKEFFKTHDIPTPRAYSVTNVRQALAALEAEEGNPVAVKPRAGSRARHTTTMVQTQGAMTKAFKEARMMCAYVAVEEHLFGPVCRATVVGGRLVGFFSGEPPRVTGDGTSSIRTLVERANASRPSRVGAISLGDEHAAFLQRSGYDFDSVPAKNAVVYLSHRTGRLFGGQTRELLDSVHPTLRATVEKAARALDVPVVGFDLIIPDPEKDPHSQRWGIIEANSLPFIDLHYLPLHGTPSNPAAAVWDLWEAPSASTP